MNKLAAEKIAQQYYQIGHQLALESMGMTKEAKVDVKRLLKALGIGTAGVVGGTAAATQTVNPIELMDIIRLGAKGIGGHVSNLF